MAKLRHAKRALKMDHQKFQDKLTRLTAKANVGDTESHRLQKQLATTTSKYDDARKALRIANSELDGFKTEARQLSLEVERLRFVHVLFVTHQFGIQADVSTWRSSVAQEKHDRFANSCRQQKLAILPQNCPCC